MSNVLIQSRAVLAGRMPVKLAGVSIEALPEGTVLHILSRLASELIPDHIAKISSSGLNLRPVSPGQWFGVSDNIMRPDEIKALAANLKPDADIVDQSHGRVRILISGPKTTRVLAKGTAVDLSVASFPIDHACTTLIGHIPVHLTRIGEDRFEMAVLRGFAESLWDEITSAATELS